MAKITVLSCDRCSKTDGVDTYRVRLSDGQSFTVDLCPRHATPLLELRDAAAGSGAHRQPGIVYDDPDEIPRTE